MIAFNSLLYFSRKGDYLYKLILDVKFHMFGYFKLSTNTGGTF